MDDEKLHKVHGKYFFCVLLVMRILNRKGIKTCDIKTTQTMPVTEIKAIDFNAGCFAKIKMPSPATVVMADKKIDDLKEDKFFLPVLYCCNKPSMMKML